MVLKRIRFPKENFNQMFEELGKLENGSEFIDMNSEIIESKKEFFEPILRCKEIEKKFLKIEKICDEFNFELKKYDDLKSFYEDLNKDEKYHKGNSNDYIDIIEHKIYEDEKKLDDFIYSKNHSINEIIDLHDKFHAFKNIANSLDILKQLQPVDKNLFKSDYSINDEERDLCVSLLEEGHYENNLLYICGVLRSEDKMKFQRMIFRQTFNRCNIKFMDIPEIKTKYIVDMETNKVKFFY